MPHSIGLEPHLTDDQLHARYRQAHDPVERAVAWLTALTPFDRLRASGLPRKGQSAPA
jgi:hypothetical protein